MIKSTKNAQSKNTNSPINLNKIKDEDKQEQLQRRTRSQNKKKKNLSNQKANFEKLVKNLRKDYQNSDRLRQIKHKNHSKSLNHVAIKHLESKSGKFLEPTKIISVSAEKWVIFDYYSSKYIRGYKAHDQHQLSVFSKLLVFCTLNTLINKHKIDTSRFQTIVMPSVKKYYKNCKLQVDDIITLDHLIHLLLMDQGEEYQLIIAINVGAYLQKKRKKDYYSVYDADQKYFKVHMEQFYGLVNSYCKTMKLENIKYVQSDPNKRKQSNKCSASDIATLSSQCLKIPLFRQILELPSKTIEIKYIDNQSLKVRTMELKNKTVDNPFISYFNVCRNWAEDSFLNSSGSIFYEQPVVQPIIVVLLGSYLPRERQKDIQQIIQWYLKAYKTQKQKLLKKQNTEQTLNRNKTNQNKNKQDEQAEMNIIQMSAKEVKRIQSIQNRFKTEQKKQLQMILQQKLKGSDQKSYKIRTKQPHTNASSQNDIKKRVITSM